MVLRFENGEKVAVRKHKGRFVFLFVFFFVFFLSVCDDGGAEAKYAEHMTTPVAASSKRRHLPGS
jgi:hypothetical protein